MGNTPSSWRPICDLDSKSNHVTASRQIAGPVTRSSLETWIKTIPGGLVWAEGSIRIDDCPDDRTVLLVSGSSIKVSLEAHWEGNEDTIVAYALPNTPRAALIKWLNILK